MGGAGGGAGIPVDTSKPLPTHPCILAHVTVDPAWLQLAVSMAVHPKNKCKAWSAGKGQLDMNPNTLEEREWMDEGVAAILPKLIRLSGEEEEITRAMAKLAKLPPAGAAIGGFLQDCFTPQHPHLGVVFNLNLSGVKRWRNAAPAKRSAAYEPRPEHCFIQRAGDVRMSCLNPLTLPALHQQNRTCSPD